MATVATTMTTGYIAPKRSAILSKWLTKTNEYNIEYRGFLSNHLAHYLVVLGCIDLDDATAEEKMEWWWDLYTDKLEPMPSIASSSSSSSQTANAGVSSDPAIEVTNSNWYEFVNNNREHYPELCAYFGSQIAARGTRAVICEHLPYVMDGLAGAALHPIIHLGMGLEAGNSSGGDMVVAQALAYLSCRSLILCIPVENDLEPAGVNEEGVAAAASVPPPNPRGLLESSLEFLEEARVGHFAALSDKAIQKPPYSKLATSGFQKKMRCFNDTSLPHAAALAALFEFQIDGVESPAREEDWLATEPEPMPEAVAGLAQAVVEATTVMAAAYLASDCEFFVTHGVTSLHGAIVAMTLLPLSAQVKLLRYWWRAAMATLVSTGIQGYDKLRQLLNTWGKKGEDMRVDKAGGRDADIETGPAITDDEHEPDQNNAVSEEWWRETLDAAITSTDEHPAKAVYVLWRWSQFKGMPQRSIDIFKEAAAWQIRPNEKGTGPEDNVYFA